MVAICKECGSDQDVTWAPEPYEHDIHGDETPVWMCEPCRNESAAEI